MSQVIKLKRTNTQGNTADGAGLVLGEMAMNTRDGYLWTPRDTDGTGTNNELISVLTEKNSISNLSDVYSSMSPIDGQVLKYDSTNGWQAENAITPTVTDFISTANQTVFTLNYNTSNVEVYIGGIKANPDSYTATNGTSITLDTGVNLDTWVQISTEVNVGGSVAHTDIANTFTEPQRTSTSSDDNNIDFTQNNNFEITATAALMGTPTLTGCTGQSGFIIISSAENITGWDSTYKFKTTPTSLTGEEVFTYFIQSETSIRIGRLV